jgi:Glycosyltransferase family 87
MTLPLTRPSQRSSSQNHPPGWRGWLARRAVVVPRQRAAALCAALEREWMAGLLAACAVFACVVAAISANPPQRMWGTVAAGGYGVAALVALAGRRRAIPLAAAISIGGALIAPLAWMASTGTGQPEVGVIIRSAVLFLHHGTPYQSAAAIAAAHNNPNVYDPYLPALAVFGIPHAIFGGGLLTDPRVWFGVVFVAAFGLALSVSGVPRPWAWTVLVTASPVVAYPLATGGDDLPVLALICLGLALLRPVWAAPARPGAPPVAQATTQVVAAGVALGLAAAMKATAWPALAVALALVAARSGRRGATWLVVATLSVPLAVDGPVLLAQPGSMVSNTILFPLGMTKIKSPAASVLPGHLIAANWSWGHWAAVGLVLLAGLAIAVSLIVRPPRDARAAGWRLVVGLTLMFALAPASRFGYIVYPLGLACWLLLARLTTGLRQPVTSILPHRMELR